MDTKVGDRIVVESEKVGKPAREGEILEVMESPTTGTRFRVCWDDGHESTFWPKAGSVRTIRRDTPTKS